MASVYPDVNPGSSLSLLAIQRSRSWRIETPLPTAARSSATGAGALLVAAFAIALFYFFFV